MVPPMPHTRRMQFHCKDKDDLVGLKQISGVGGQVDFIRGASMADHGISILAFPSTAAKGKISKIVPFLDEGAAVTTPPEMISTMSLPNTGLLI